MSLDVRLTAVRPVEVFDANITHNLGKMASQCGLYEPLWTPELIPVTKASELVPLLRVGIDRLCDERESLLQYEPTNGWGTHADLYRFASEYLQACIENPDAEIHVSR